MQSLRISLAFLGVILTFSVPLFLGKEGVMHAYAAGRDGDPLRGLSLFARVLTQLEEVYVEELDSEELIWRAMEGMTESLDPHTRFLDPDTYQSLKSDHEGRYYGIGIESLPAEDGSLEVLRVMERSPAEVAGLVQGDRIQSVDSVDVREGTFQEAAARIRGPRGIAVTLGVLRQHSQELEELRVVRDEILTRSVEGVILESGWLQLRIEEFQTATADQLEEVYRRLSQGLELRGLILDMRDNPGGLLSSATEVLDLFLEEGLLVTTESRHEQERESFHASPGLLVPAELPVAVLINSGSASASEIVAGTLQEAGRATIYGSRSYGKGSVQRLYEFTGGSALKATVGRYLLPSGESVEGAGVMPDELIPPPPERHPLKSLRARVQQLELSPTEQEAWMQLLDQLAEQVPEEEGAEDPVLEQLLQRLEAP